MRHKHCVTCTTSRELLHVHCIMFTTLHALRHVHYVAFTASHAQTDSHTLRLMHRPTRIHCVTCTDRFAYSASHAHRLAYTASHSQTDSSTLRRMHRPTRIHCVACTNRLHFISFQILPHPRLHSPAPKSDAELLLIFLCCWILNNMNRVAYLNSMWIMWRISPIGPRCHPLSPLDSLITSVCCPVQSINRATYFNIASKESICYRQVLCSLVFCYRELREEKYPLCRRIVVDQTITPVNAPEIVSDIVWSLEGSVLVSCVSDCVSFWRWNMTFRGLCVRVCRAGTCARNQRAWYMWWRDRPWLCRAGNDRRARYMWWHGQRIVTGIEKL